MCIIISFANYQLRCVVGNQNYYVTANAICVAYFRRFAVCISNYLAVGGAFYPPRQAKIILNVLVIFLFVASGVRCNGYFAFLQGIAH